MSEIKNEKNEEPLQVIFLPHQETASVVNVNKKSGLDLYLLTLGYKKPYGKNEKGTILCNIFYSIFNLCFKLRIKNLFLIN